MRKTFVTLYAVLAAAPALAQTACPMTYTSFEFAVPHIDMEACPDGFVEVAAFCRASAGNDALHVFAFAEEGEQCLLKVESLDEDAFEVSVK